MSKSTSNKKSGDENEEEYKYVKFNNSLDFYTLNVMVKTNITGSTATRLTKDMLYISDRDEQEARQINLETYPLFTYKYDYPVEKLRKIRNYKERMNVFFNEFEFKRVMTTEIKTLKSEEERNERINNNIMIMFEILFPTTFPVIDNLHTSYEYLTRTSSKRPLFYNPSNFHISSKLNINGKQHMIKKVIFYNDIINHPKYNNLVKETIKFQNWAKQQKKDYINMDINKSREALPIELTSYERSFLLKFKAPNRIINNDKLQKLIRLEDINDKQNFHKAIRDIYETHLLNLKLVSEYEELVKGGVCDIETKNISKPTKEVYVMIDLHDENFTRCSYYDNFLGTELEKIIQGITPNGKYVEGDIGGVSTTTTTDNNDITGNINKENVDKDNNEQSDAFEYDNINSEFLRYSDNYKWKQSRGKNKTQELKEKYLDNIKKTVGKVVGYEKYTNTDPRIDNIVENIVKGKFKKEESDDLNFSKKFKKIFQMWYNELFNGASNIRNVELITLIKGLKREINGKKESNKDIIKANEQLPKPEHYNQKVKLEYHELVYIFYENVLDVLIISLDEFYGENVDTNLIEKDIDINKEEESRGYFGSDDEPRKRRRFGGKTKKPKKNKFNRTLKK
tara:strand:- start:2592 stop:4463 length:1872 start_codon:yes stop_codon:yes gene_type:complete